MGDFTTQLTQDIKKLVGVLKSEDKLVEVLKRKLTKKEFRYYKLRLENSGDEVLKEQLKCDDKRLEEIKKQTVLKLNQEKIKKELID